MTVLSAEFLKRHLIEDRMWLGERERTANISASMLHILLPLYSPPTLLAYIILSANCMGLSKFYGCHKLDTKQKKAISTEWLSNEEGLHGSASPLLWTKLQTL